MGKSLNWYVIPKDIIHDQSKQLCFNWEFQDDEEEIEEAVFNQVVDVKDREIVKHKDESMVDYFTRKTEHQKHRSRLLYKHLYDDKALPMWCPKCHLFAHGIYNSPLILAHKDVHHSYSNPMLNSKWDVGSFYLGSSLTDFARLFRDDQLVREIDTDNINRALETIKELGEPRRKSDKDACSETIEVLSFLKEWTCKDDVIVLMVDEV